MDITTSQDSCGEQVLIACEMIEDEVRAALDCTGAELDVIWVERGFHIQPAILRAELQRLIDWADSHGARQILLAFGLCGGGAENLHTHQALLAAPRFDDCVNFMLETGERCCRGKARAGVYYLTRGWTQEGASLPMKQWVEYTERFGERKAKRLMEAMFGAYRSVTLIDNGCYDLDDVMPIAHEIANSIGVDDVCQVDGSNKVLEKLLTGDWDDDIVVCNPGRPVLQSDFEYEGL